MIIFLIVYFSTRGATTLDFFNAQKKAPWFAVAFGMVGVAMSGVLFLSIPGDVGQNGFSNIQLVFGYLLGYTFIATVLLPIYYQYNLISIYSFFETRFGFWSHKTGSFFFLISRLLRTSFRVFIVVSILHELYFSNMGISFGATLFFGVTFVWLYSFRAGIKGIIWTDVFNTCVIIFSILSVFYMLVFKISDGFNDAMIMIQNSSYAEAFVWETGSKNHFFRQFFSGAFIAIVLNGLDQDMMQKNLSCKSIGDAQKNMLWFVLILVAVNITLLAMGAMLFIYSDAQQISFTSIDLFTYIATNELGQATAILFMLGLIAAVISSTDSAIISLTTSYCIDFLDFTKTRTGEARKRMKRIQVHLFFGFLLFALVMFLRAINNEKIVEAIFTVAGYTYGPLLGLFIFGIFTKWNLKDQLVPIVSAIALIISYLLDFFSEELFNGYKFGYELVLINALMTFTGLLLIIKKKEKQPKAA
ncbi:sodium:solute symporter [Chondrinema litorale]|uniref:sodium:solute symporter n=1 Tax=Chondrinema litorale TaxID=2994555 RepID=UPI002543122B|nr:sodium:solute symporter [Chondrinema litorale]UZR92342.1 sodium:solute symporter [Chondrinema litorale]